MANRQTTFLLKRSNVPGKVPPSSGLTSGELALNTADAILYTSGSTANQILPIGWDRIHRTGDTVTGDFTFYGNINIGNNLNVSGNTILSSTTATTIYTDYIDFNIAATPIQPTLGRLSWNSADRTLDLGNGDGDSILQIGQETVYPPVFNADSIDLVEGTLVMIDPGQIAQGNDVRVVRAVTDGTYPSQYLIGILTEDILQGQLGLATWFGKVRNLNSNTLETNGIKSTGETWSEGAVLYPNPLVAGGLTITPPQAPNINGTIAVITAVNGVNITLLVRPTLTFKLTELTNVRTSGLTDGDILVYNSGDTVWDSTKTLRGDYVVDGSLSATTYYNLPIKVSLDFGFDGTYTTTSSTFAQVPLNVVIQSASTYNNTYTGMTGILICDISQSDSGINGEFELYNLTDSTSITGSQTSFVDTDDLKSSSSFTISNLNFDDTFRIRMRRTSGSGTNNVRIRSAQLLLTLI